MKRRSFLALARKGLAWFVAGLFVYPALRFALWREKKIRLVRFAHQELSARTIRDEVCLTPTPRGPMALSLRCPHLCCVLAYDPSADIFVCPCHRSRFNGQGELLAGPATTDLARLPVKELDNGDVEVEVPV
ncbi:MAG: Rieske (2Fe-2S) protein [Desulfovibrio sp.]|nr:MAG: Rieske (2Fe-2S) protein [Desulfovibrio sp.]